MLHCIWFGLGYLPKTQIKTFSTIIYLWIFSAYSGKFHFLLARKISCFSCNSSKNKACEDPFPKREVASPHLPTLDCYEDCFKWLYIDHRKTPFLFSLHFCRKCFCPKWLHLPLPCSNEPHNGLAQRVRCTSVQTLMDCTWTHPFACHFYMSICEEFFPCVLL